MRSRIVPCMEVSERCCRVEGANMSMSRCRRSHQKGAVSSMEEQLVLAVTMARMIAVCRLVKEDLLRERRKWHHVVRKSGGLWS